MNTAALFDRALTLMESKKFEEAEPILLELHHQSPGDARVNFSLGLVYDDKDEIDLCLRHLEKAAAVAKKKAVVFEELALVLIRIGDYKEALAAARKATQLDPKSAHCFKVLGDAYAKLQRPVLARQAFERALAIDPDLTGALIACSKLEKSLGRQAESDALLERARTTKADIPALLIEEAGAKKHKEKPEALDKLKELIESHDGMKRNQIAHLYYAAGKIHDDLDEMAEAFKYFEKGKEYLYSPYDPRLRRWQIESYKAYFTPDFFEERKSVAFESEKPVFVVGMPRSGTTLTEQIIGRHPKAVGAGELTYFTLESKSLYKGTKITPEFFSKISRMDERDFRRIGRGYLNLIESIGGKASRVVDKMPHNFENLWLMALLFPNATFIHLNRNPIDNCISIYTTPLRDGHNYASSQKNLGEYYCMYRDLTDHWAKVLPVNIRQQSYEALVADQEAESRQLVDHCKLPWDDACLEFYKGDRQVTTFSIDQVRKPIYTSSVNRWKRYESEVGDLIEALGPYAPARG